MEPEPETELVARHNFVVLWLRPAIAAAVVGVVTFFFVSVPVERQRIEISRRNAELQARIDEQRARLQLLEKASRRSGEVLQTLRSADLRIIELGRGGRAAEPAGRIFWDRERGRWWVQARGLQPTPAGRDYRLWFVNAAGERIVGPALPVDRAGRAELLTEPPRDRGRISGAEITDEPEGAATSPTGELLLAGTLVGD